MRGELIFEELEARGFEVFALGAGEEGREELEVFEGVVGGVENGGGLFAQGGGDDGLEDDDPEEWCFGS